MRCRYTGLNSFSTHQNDGNKDYWENGGQKDHERLWFTLEALSMMISNSSGVRSLKK